jgi:hypothetical protein
MIEYISLRRNIEIIIEAKGSSQIQPVKYIIPALKLALG